MTRRVLWGAMAAVAAALATAAPAGAALEVTEFSLTPSTTKAGANADVTIVTGFRAYQALQPAPEQAKALVFHLPPGLAGDPFATPRVHRGAVPGRGVPAREPGRRGRRGGHGAAARHRPHGDDGGGRRLQPRARGHGAGAARRGAPAGDPRRRAAVRADADQGPPGRRRPGLRDPRAARDRDGGRRLRPRVHVEDDVHAVRQAAGRRSGRSCATRPRARRPRRRWRRRGNGAAASR